MNNRKIRGYFGKTAPKTRINSGARGAKIYVGLNIGTEETGKYAPRGATKEEER
jgi:hypothetical protein